MLNGTADAASDIHFGTDGDACLTNLQVVVGKACIHGSTAGTHFCMKYFGEFIQLVKAFLRADAIASSHNDRSAFQVVLGCLDVTVEHLGDVLCLGNELRYIFHDDLALVVLVEYLCLHHAAANSRHLRSVLGIDDGSHDVSTEGGSYLIQQVLVRLTILLVLMRTNLKAGAVRGESAMQSRRDARTEVATYDVSSHQANLRFLLLEEVDEDCRVRLARIGSEAFCIEDMEFIDAIRKYLSLHFSHDSAAGSNGFELYAKRIGQLPAFSQKLLAYFGNLCAFKLAINKYTIHRALSDCVACEEFLDETVHVLVTAG